jgi:FAD/FMN-containing dehydrogenase
MCMTINKKLKSPILTIGVLVLVSVTFITKKILYLSADPTKDKSCGAPLISSKEKSRLSKLLNITIPGINLPWTQKTGVIDDISCLNKTQVYGIVSPTKIEDFKEAITFANDENLKISIAGAKHSMGGQAFAKDAVIIDITQFNKMTLNKKDKVLTVESGATWQDIQKFLHPKYAVKSMQSTNIFTVGGSISVNAHGMDHKAGSIYNTIRSMKVLLMDGSVVTASRTENPQLFNLVIGGYGLFGIVLEADIEVVDNDIYQYSRQVIDYKDFLSVYKTQIDTDNSIALFYGHLSTAPGTFLKEVILYKYNKVSSEGAIVANLEEASSVKLKRLVLNLAKYGWPYSSLKWFAEKNIEPYLESCPVYRNEALGQGEGCLVSRNEPMQDSVPYLRNNLKNDTDILHEYFIPRDNLILYIDDLRKILSSQHLSLLNASIRVVNKEDNFLTYAPKESFSVVLYINQSADAKGNAEMQELTSKLIDLAIKYDGRFFLPYQLHYSKEQLKIAYPEINNFFELKRKYDPGERFVNKFYSKYGKDLF